MGEAPTNNDGREFISPDESISCHAYGFNNSLFGKSGEPQTLDEFVDWLSEEEVLSKSKTTMAGYPAKELVIKKEGTVSQGVYILGKEEGRGLVCYYPDLSSKKSFQDNFKKMQLSFNLNTALDSESDNLTCGNYLNGVLEPVKMEQFIDTKYTSVTIMSRDSWDRSLIQKDVLHRMDLGYECDPLPLEFEGGEPEGGVMVEPMVTKVQWDCVLEYEDYKYLESTNEGDIEKSKLEGQGYTCVSERCFVDGPMVNISSVWLCTK